MHILGGLGKQGHRWRRSLWTLQFWGGLLRASGEGTSVAPVNGQERKERELALLPQPLSQALGTRRNGKNVLFFSGRASLGLYHSQFQGGGWRTLKG